MLKIENNRVVSLRYRMSDTTGTVIIDLLAGPPVQYIHGTGAIHPELEKPLIGLIEGSCKKIEFYDEKLGGKIRFEIIIQGVREATPLEISEGNLNTSPEDTNCGPDCKC